MQYTLEQLAARFETSADDIAGALHAGGYSAASYGSDGRSPVFSLDAYSYLCELQARQEEATRAASLLDRDAQTPLRAIAKTIHSPEADRRMHG